MTLAHSQIQLLRSLLCLARRDVPAAIPVLALEVRRSEADVQRDLVFLDRRGLVDARRVRLTFVGLAHAASGAEIAVPALARRAA
jgi:hypothetical protein